MLILLRKCQSYGTVCGIALQQADYGYFRHRNCGGSFVRNMMIIYSLDGTSDNVYGSRGAEFEWMGSM